MTSNMLEVGVSAIAVIKIKCLETRNKERKSQSQYKPKAKEGVQG